MASPNSGNVTFEEQATRDRFFSAHSGRRILAGTLQLRNHFAPLANVNGAAGWADLTYGRLSSPNVMKWYARTSGGFAFSAAAYGPATRATSSSSATSTKMATTTSSTAASSPRRK